jgi:hypothetical protein
MSLDSRFAELGLAHKLSPDQELVLAAAGLGLEEEVCSISLNNLLLSDFSFWVGRLVQGLLRTCISFTDLMGIYSIYLLPRPFLNETFVLIHSITDGRGEEGEEREG